MPNSGPVDLHVIDAQYKPLGSFRYEAGQPGARLLRVAAPGTYYMQLHGYANDAERFVLTVRQPQ